MSVNGYKFQVKPLIKLGFILRKPWFKRPCRTRSYSLTWLTLWARARPCHFTKGLDPTKWWHFSFLILCWMNTTPWCTPMSFCKFFPRIKKFQHLFSKYLHGISAKDITSRCPIWLHQIHTRVFKKIGVEDNQRDWCDVAEYKIITRESKKLAGKRMEWRFSGIEVKKHYCLVGKKLSPNEWLIKS